MNKINIRKKYINGTVIERRENFQKIYAIMDKISKAINIVRGLNNWPLS